MSLHLQAKEEMNPEAENGRIKECRRTEPKELRKMRTRKIGAWKEGKQRSEKPCEDERSIMVKMIEAIKKKSKEVPSSTCREKEAWIKLFASEKSNQPTCWEDVKE